jgi:hypothetical protein
VDVPSLECCFFAKYDYIYLYMWMDLSYIILAYI